MSRSRALSPLRHSGFRYYLAARFSTLLGNAIAPIAVAFAVLDISGSATALGVVLAARTIANIVFVLYGGVISDRFRRDVVLIVTAIVCFVTQALAAGLLAAGVADVWHIAVIQTVNGAAAAFSFPALQGIVPQLVNRDEIQQASALNGLARNVSLIGGGAAGGAIVGFFGPGFGLAVDAAAFGVAALLISRLKLAQVPSTASGSMIRDLRDGWREFVSRRWVWVVVAVFFFVNMMTAGWYQTLGPVIADESFGRVGWGTLSAATGVGFVIGALIMLRWRPRRPMVVALLAALVDVPLLVTLGLDPVFLPLLVLSFLVGIGSDLFGIGWETALQQHIPHDKLSRVASYDMLGSIAAMPIGQLTAGPLAAQFGAGPVLVGGAIVIAVALFAALADRSVRQLTRVDSVEERATALAS